MANSPQPNDERDAIAKVLLIFYRRGLAIRKGGTLPPRQKKDTKKESRANRGTRAAGTDDDASFAEVRQ